LRRLSASVILIWIEFLGTLGTDAVGKFHRLPFRVGGSGNLHPESFVVTHSFTAGAHRDKITQRAEYVCIDMSFHYNILCNFYTRGWVRGQSLKKQFVRLLDGKRAG
jgi:hypothetical protein